MFKDILLTTLKDIKERESRKESVMKDCIDVKLERSLNNYEENLKETCKYILSKNPISIIKKLNKDFEEEQKQQEQEELSDDEI